MDSTGQFAYVANRGSNNISAYTIDGMTGALVPVQGSPFPNVGSEGVIVDLTGQFLYATNSGCNGTVSGYTLDGQTGL